jgi:hypothetical protein
VKYPDIAAFRAQSALVRVQGRRKDGRAFDGIGGDLRQSGSINFCPGYSPKRSATNFADAIAGKRSAKGFR